MSHNINTYIGRLPAWHKLGTVTGKFTTWAEILAHGGLDFQVEKLQLLSPAGVLVEAWGTFRTDNTEFLGPVGSEYTVIDHARGFEMVDALVSSKDGAHYETAGVLGKGEVVWGLANLNLEIRVGDDISNGFLLFATSYDGRFSHQYRTTVTRVVCQNTLNAAMSGKAAGFFRIRHTKNANDRIDQAHAALETVTEEFGSMSEKLNFLATRRVTRETLTAIMDRLFPKPKTEDKDTPATRAGQTRRENVLGEILALYESNDHNAFPEERGTAYNLLNAITEYADHARSSITDRATSAMFGTGDRLKTQALEVIVETAAGMEPAPTRQIYRTIEVPPADVSTGSALLDDVLSATPN